MKHTAYLLDYLPQPALKPGVMVTLHVSTAVSSWNFYRDRYPQYIQPRFGLPVELGIPALQTPAEQLQIGQPIKPAQAVVEHAQTIPDLYTQPAPALFASPAVVESASLPELPTARKTDSVPSVLVATEPKEAEEVFDIPKVLSLPEPAPRVDRRAVENIWLQKKSAVLRTAGTGMIAVSLATVLFFSAPVLSIEIQTAIRNLAQSKTSANAGVSLPQSQTLQEVPSASGSAEQRRVASDSAGLASPIPAEEQKFQLIIPQIGINSKVIANVDASNPKAYQAALKEGVAHAQGTGLPGEDGGHNKTIFLFAHSTDAPWNIQRLNALFYSIKDLKPGDEFSVWFWGKEYRYTVREQKIVASNDVSFLQPQMETERLILQTCWPPGTVNKRLLIFAERVGGQDEVSEKNISVSLQKSKQDRI